jgi:mono/diheme cytochrome c family protein
MHASHTVRRLAVLAITAGALACQTGQGSSTSSTTTTTSSSTSTLAAIPAGGAAVQAASMEQAGEYLTIVGSCNDCHTQGWAETEGKVPPADRFAGLNVGFRGKWGTSYGKNLRTVVQRQSEDHWVKVLTTADEGDGKPPMPWWNTKQMSDRDLRAMYRYIKSLGPKANGVPRALPPGKEPTGPYIWVEPRTGP